jgi:hypothetical protein
MAVLQNLITEIDNVHGAISDYSEKIGAYLFNPAQPLPQFDESKLTIDEVLTQARNNKDSAVDLTSGAVHSTAYKVAGIVRELGSRTMTKAMLYDLAVTEAGLASNEARGDGGKKLAELRSMTPSQTEGT